MCSLARRPPDHSRRLDKIQLLTDLPSDVIRQLVGDCQWQIATKGQELFGAGVVASDVCFVTAGLVRVTWFSAHGREVSFRDLRAGATFGTVSAVDGLPRSASVVAVEDATIAVLSPERFRALVLTHPKFALAVLVEFAALIRELTNRVVITTTATVPVRVRQELLRLALEAGVAGNMARLDRLPTHAEIATRVGATREAVTREFTRLSQSKILSRHGKGGMIMDVQRLQHMADG